MWSGIAQKLSEVQILKGICTSLLSVAVLLGHCEEMWNSARISRSVRSCKCCTVR